MDRSCPPSTIHPDVCGTLEKGFGSPEPKSQLLYSGPKFEAGLIHFALSILKSFDEVLGQMVADNQRAGSYRLTRDGVIDRLLSFVASTLKLAATNESQRAKDRKATSDSDFLYDVTETMSSTLSNLPLIVGALLGVFLPSLRHRLRTKFSLPTSFAASKIHPKDSSISSAMDTGAPVECSSSSKPFPQLYVHWADVFFSTRRTTRTSRGDGGDFGG